MYAIRSYYGLVDVLYAIRKSVVKNDVYEAVVNSIAAMHLISEISSSEVKKSAKNHIKNIVLEEVEHAKKMISKKATDARHMQRRNIISDITNFIELDLDGRNNFV